MIEYRYKFQILSEFNVKVEGIIRRDRYSRYAASIESPLPILRSRDRVTNSSRIRNIRTHVHPVSQFRAGACLSVAASGVTSYRSEGTSTLKNRGPKV